MDLSRMFTSQHMAKVLLSELPPPENCQACGKLIPVRDHAINFAYTSRVFIGSPGHPGLGPVACHEGEHWACSPECWSIVAHNCIDNHIVPTLGLVHDHLKGIKNNVSSTD